MARTPRPRARQRPERPRRPHYVCRVAGCPQRHRWLPAPEGTTAAKAAHQHYMSRHYAPPSPAEIAAFNSALATARARGAPAPTRAEIAAALAQITAANKPDPTDPTGR